VRRFGISIRTKLLLTTLVLVLIPFVGYGYVRELESFLRSGQEQAVIATARAAATALHDRPKLLELRTGGATVLPTPEPINPDLPAPAPEDGPLNRDMLETALNDRIRITRPPADQANEEIERIIRGMGRGNSRIWVVDQQRRLLAVTGSLQRDQRNDPLIPATSEGTWGQIEERILRPLYTWLLAPPNEDFEDALPETVLSGGRDLDRALTGIAASRWRHTTDFRATVISAAHPIWSGDEVVGAVVIEETANAVLMLRNRAFEHLLTMTLAVFLFGAGALALFATRLSARLARLRDEADSAIDLRGRVKHLVQGSDAGDEIGDLSRSFSTMLARLAQYNTYLERMADRLSHELRTPAAVVSSSLDNLRSKNLPGDAEVYISRAEDGVKRLNMVLTRMREATQLEHMLREVERERFDLARVIAGCVEGYRGVFSAHRFLPLLPPTPVWLVGAPDLVAQLLDKIVENAVDFSPAGEIIEITVAIREASAVLTVSNIGPLLPDAMQGEIFESMISVRDKAEGGKATPHLGLGLFMVRLIAEFHNAKASARNRTDGRGVAIEVAFPLAI
jgi:two-component system, OmpR family, sensor histidine kinase ChvG